MVRYEFEMDKIEMFCNNFDVRTPERGYATLSDFSMLADI